MNHGQDAKNDQINLWLAELDDALLSESGSKVEVYRVTLLKLARLVRRQRIDVINAEEATFCTREDGAVKLRRSMEINARLREVLRHYACDCAETGGEICLNTDAEMCGYKAREALEGRE